jgi:hypothetical protein
MKVLWNGKQIIKMRIMVEIKANIFIRVYFYC